MWILQEQNNVQTFIQSHKTLFNDKKINRNVIYCTFKKTFAHEESSPENLLIFFGFFQKKKIQTNKEKDMIT